MNKFYSLSVLCFVFNLGLSQSLVPYECDVIIDNQTLEMPFLGGLNNPQTYPCDLNNDGIPDLVIMDRDGGAILPFIRINNEEGINLRYAPEYKPSFIDVRQWFVMRDFNQDGIQDLFCFPVGNLPGIEIRKGYYSNDTLLFETIRFNEITGAPDILPIPSTNGNYTQLYVGNNDQPEIIDVDEDGDVDVLTFDSGGSYLHYWRNYAVEKGLSLDTFSMELEDACWGKFFELETSQEILLSNSPSECASLVADPTVSNRHAGSCVTVFDENGDGVLDLLLGDLSNDQMVMLTNEGSSVDAWMTSQDGSFPSYDIPIKMDIFNAAFYVDINNDQKRDLIASPNANGNVENHRVMWYYKNVGTDDNPSFEYRKDVFLVEDMIDFGAASSPRFVDHNQDGLMDIVVGCRGRYIGAGMNDLRMYYLENTGTAEIPVFTLMDDDYAGYAQFASQSLTFHPAFGDLDGDGDMDMLVGDNSGYLYYSENIAGPGNPLSFATAVSEYMDIRPGNIAQPFIMDLDQDGLSDIIIGERNNNSDGNGKVGALVFYPNQGSVGSPLFVGDETIEPNIVAFGNVNTQTIFDVTATTCPYFYNQGENVLMVAGSKGGALRLYDNILGNLDGDFNVLDENFGTLNEGESTTPALYDIDDDGKLEMLVGNERGGLSFFQTDILASDEVSTVDIGLDWDVEILPNPGSEVVNVSSKESLDIRLVNLSGQVLYSQKEISKSSISVAHLPKGLYFFHFQKEGKTSIEKFIKI